MRRGASFRFSAEIPFDVLRRRIPTIPQIAPMTRVIKKIIGTL